MKYPLILLLSLLALASCSSKKTGTITVLTTTDLHGWVLSWDYARDQAEPRNGLERVATLVDSIRRSSPNALLIDAGDWLQGNSFAAYFAEQAPESEDYPLLRVADMLNYDAFVLGNHEFNYGLDYLNTRISQSKTPVIGANIYKHGTDSTAYTPYIMKTVDGFNVAILGITTPGTMVWDRQNVQGKIEVRDALIDTRKWVASLRELGAEVIVVLAHTGYEGASSYHDADIGRENVGKAILDSIPDVDLLVFGHSHRVTQGPDHIQAGRWASHLGEAKLFVRRTEDGDVVVDSIQTKAHAVVNAAPSARVRDLVAEEHELVRSHVNAHITTITEEWTSADARLVDAPIVDLIHHVQFKVTNADLSAASAFTTNATFTPPSLTRRNLAAIYPYENKLYVIEINGKQLRDYLEYTSNYYLVNTEAGTPLVNRTWPGYNFDTVNGVEYELDLRKEPGSRLVYLRRNGRAVRNTDTFTMAVNSYRAESGGGFTMLAGSPVTWRSDVSVKQMLETELSGLDTLRVEDVHRVNWKLRF